MDLAWVVFGAVMVAFWLWFMHWARDIPRRRAGWAFVGVGLLIESQAAPRLWHLPVLSPILLVAGLGLVAGAFAAELRAALGQGRARRKSD
ncbi:hypothetical protein [Streptacidiphilus jiangxiensis]|uniref:Uncharacterized protein n=1 Tax=Streptacidiphilus jiangxiensis TaxID=235985 RepID=A0A1H8AMN6_STRJI|nr:hypothetical protein [Streptacidiphilus jiangxiensis]SEM71921.1 hypothetical protein SAMN05414137_14724 [Streptacidiphilus jiangxiensis]